MAVFINWFGVEIIKNLQLIPAQTFEDRESAQIWLENTEIKWERRILVPDVTDGSARAIVYVLSDIDQMPTESVDIRKNPRLSSRILDVALAEMFRGRGDSVRVSGFGVEATRPSFDIKSILLRIETGVICKSYFVSYRDRIGVTISYRVRQRFYGTLADLTKLESLEGLPVILRDQDEDLDLEEFHGKYLGIVTRIAGDQVTVRCRDFQERQFRRDQLALEARPEVFARLQPMVADELRGESLQVKMLKTSFSLNKSGRKNVRILHDRLQSAINFMAEPGSKQILLAMPKPLDGMFSLDLAPATARLTQDSNV